MTISTEFQQLLQTLYKPAQRALHSENIKSIDALYTLGKQNLLNIHGIGPETIEKIESFARQKLKE